MALSNNLRANTTQRGSDRYNYKANALEEYDPMASLVSLLLVLFPLQGNKMRQHCLEKSLISYYTENLHDEPEGTESLGNFSRAL